MATHEQMAALNHAQTMLVESIKGHTDRWTNADDPGANARLLEAVQWAHVVIAMRQVAGKMHVVEVAR